MNESRGLLDLIIRRLPGFSIADKIRLCGCFNREQDLVRASHRDIAAVLDKKGKTEPWEMDALHKEAEADARNCSLRGIKMAAYTDAAYPPLLRELYDPPVVLFYLGVLPNPEQPLIAMVGTRKPSGIGSAQAYAIARELALSGLAVVSGLALGIDSMAHRGNLDGGGRTIAVLGSGLDRIYPAGNRVLAHRILDRQGMLCSEYPPGTVPYRWHFPARNRIIAGLARGTLVVEAPASSGALITARFAMEQGRDVWVAQGALASPQGEGTLGLAQDGAMVIAGGEDIITEWALPHNNPQYSDVGTEGNRLAKAVSQSLGISIKGL